MSRNQRLALVVAALAVAAIAFVIARPGDDEEPEPASVTTSTGADRTSATSATDPVPLPAAPEPEVARIGLRGGKVAGGVKRIEVRSGQIVRIVVSADAPDQIHVHGYDIEREAAPGRPARFTFKATSEGEFELESHTAEDAGLDPLIARLVVAPG